MEYMNVKTAAQAWGISERRITMLCRNGRIAGAMKEGKSWLLPVNAVKPEDGRTSDAAIQEQTVKLRPLPIGVSDFREAVSDFYYVDKTLLIKDFLDTRAKVTLFTRPRRFGKTLNMDMLRVFLKRQTKILPCISVIKRSGAAARITASIKVNIRSYFSPLKM